MRRQPAKLPPEHHASEANQEIFLRDPKEPGFLLRGETGRDLESFIRMHEMADWGSRWAHFTVLYDSNMYLTEQSHPFFAQGKYSKKMFTIHGFFPSPWPDSGHVGSSTGGGQSGGKELIQSQPIPVPMQPRGEGPGGGSTRGRTLHEPPPLGQAGFCCVRGEVVQLPGHACQAEGGTFFSELEPAHVHCELQGRGR